MISFQNPGLIDIRCITTIGVSIKESENPIGFFGTGLKYAIAIILRNGGAIRIWRGLEELRFDSAPVEMRGVPVPIVRMNGAELGFTSDFGKHWEVWQAFRELWCNTKDEGGQCTDKEIAPDEGATTVQVWLQAFEDCYNNRGSYILQTRPICDGPVVAFHPGPSSGIFYRSVLVGKFGDKPHLFIPNVIERLELTEDRTIKDQWLFARLLAKAIVQSDDAEFIERILTASPDYGENTIDLDWSHQPSLAFLAAVRRVAADTSRPLNHTALKVLAKSEPLPVPLKADLLPTEEQALAKAIAFCRALTYPVDEYPIRVVESLGEGTLGTANRATRTITLSRRAIQMGDMMLASTLIGEWAHLKHGLDDCTRAMQNWLFEQVASLGGAYLMGAYDKRRRP